MRAKLREDEFRDQFDAGESLESPMKPASVSSPSFILSRERNAMLIDPKGNEKTEIPPALYRHLVQVVRMMKERRAILMIPEDEAFTTQAAANFLGMSRQTFVNLIEAGKIPHFTVGAHRRVLYKDLAEFQKRRDTLRRKGLNTLAIQSGWWAQVP
jgi:excisionase family DNA binding protein